MLWSPPARSLPPRTGAWARAIFGWGFEPWTGGPFSYIDFLGPEAFVAEADRLAERYGDGFRVPEQLREMAGRGETYYKQPAVQAAE